jgi:Uma2 family endonuclease
MSTIAESPPVAEDHRDVEIGYDVIDGVCVERNLGGHSSWVGANFVTVLGMHRMQQGGHVFGADGSYRIFPEPHPLRFPDASYVAPGRFPSPRPPEGPITIPPDVAVEVVSPGDGAEEVEAKALAWLNAGTKVVWVAYPLTHHVYAYTAAGILLFTDVDTLTAESVLPGFAVPVVNLFPTPEAAPVESNATPAP